MDKKNKTGIFLTGGGGIGSFQIGFFKALEEAEISFDLVCGGSVGALIGGAATYLTPEEMMEAWKTLTLESVLKIDSRKVKDLQGTKRDLMLIKECFLSCCHRDPKLMIDIDDIRKLLYASLDGDKIKESKIDFGVTTTVLPSFELQKTFKEDMKTNPLEYILASIYLPIFSRQRIIDNKHYVDLTRWRRYPIEMLKEKGCTSAYIVNIETEHKTKSKLERPISQVFDEGEDVTLVNYENLPSILDFSNEQALINYQNGYETTMRVLEKKR